MNLKKAAAQIIIKVTEDYTLIDKKFSRAHVFQSRLFIPFGGGKHVAVQIESSLQATRVSGGSEASRMEWGWQLLWWPASLWLCVTLCQWVIAVGLCVIVITSLLLLLNALQFLITKVIIIILTILIKVTIILSIIIYF